MKNLLYTFIAFIAFTANTQADGFRSKLNIRTFNNQTFLIEIDRIKYNNPTREFSINELTPGDHKIKIWMMDRCNHPYAMGNNFDLAYNGFINIPARSRVNAVLTHQGILKVTDIVALPGNFHQECNNNIGYYGSQNYCGYYSNNNTNYNNYCGNGYCNNYNNGSTCTNNNGYYDNTGSCTSNYTSYNTYGNAINSDEFQEVKAMVAAQRFDDTRIAIIKQYVSTHPINSYQLEELIRMMTFENNKMELAKFGYRYISDPHQFYTVYDAFTFDNSINELINWINHQS